MNNSDDEMMDDAGLNQTVESLAREANSRFSAGKGGEWILNGIVALSAILSAIFFWENSATVFSRVWPPAALVLGLAVGLLPSEGAFFGWRKVRETKSEMTNGQVRATTTGIGFAVFFSVFSTFALFVSGFPAVPDTIRQYSDWMTFIALAVPILIQFSLFAVFVVNEQAVLQNHKRAKVSAMRFDSLIRFEEAKVMAALLGMEAQLNRDLKGYGAHVGGRQGRAFLNRPRTVTDQPENQLPASAIPDAAISAVLHGDQRPGKMARLFSRRDAAPDNDAVMAVVQQMIASGQIALISNSTNDASRHDGQPEAAANGHEAGQGATDTRP